MTHERYCICGGKFKRILERRQYHCTKCSYQIAPTAGTIFEHTKIPLTLWFHALMMFSNAKSGIAAKTIERDLEITYKTAWRMATLIRSTLLQSEEPLTGVVETDMGYFGGKGVAGKDNKHLSAVMKAKTKVFAAIQRKGGTRAKVVKDGSAKTHKNFLWQHVSTKSTKLMTDGALPFVNSASPYDREFVSHKRGEFVRGNVHTNSADSFWSHVKASVRGTHKAISPKYFQTYLDGFVFHANNRHSDKERFDALLGSVLRAKVISRTH
jgi:transposase